MKIAKGVTRMGYTTIFKGALTISPLPTDEIVEIVIDISKTRHDEIGYPSIWCQWVINSDRKLEWNGAEKFYNYIEWLRYLIDNIFVPNGYILNGRIRYRGERIEDIGVIYVKDNEIKNILGIYDITDDEIIIAFTMEENGESRIEILT